MIDENLQIDASGDITGTVTTTSARCFKLAGFVNTSHGRIETEVAQSVNFKNLQTFDITASVYGQDVSQLSNVESTTTTRQGPLSFQTQETFSYPFTFNYTDTFNADGSVTQLSNVSEGYKKNLWSPFFASFVDNQVTSTDLLDLNSSFEITGKLRCAIPANL